MKPRKKSAIIIGDTRKFHLGSRINCDNLVEIISKKYNLIGLGGGKDFKFYNYQELVKKINHSKLLKKIEASNVIFCNGEGFIEPGSPYGKALFYLAKFIRNSFDKKKVYLINFSCFDQKYGDWSLFDMVVPRDYGSYVVIRSKMKRIKLGFDCSILEKLPKEALNSSYKILGSKNIILFRGRRQIFKKQLNLLKLRFDGFKIIPVSGFWKFKKGVSSKQVSSKYQLYKLLAKSHLVVSSSFHGIIFSALFAIPFIPLPTYPIPKNESIASDILGKYYKDRNLKEWIEFYKNERNYLGVKKHLLDSLPKFKKRALNYII